jgi:hypothetical protein
MILRRLVALCAVLSLGACATVERFDAAGDIHALLVAIRDGDKATFDMHVDRPALKEQLRSRVLAGIIKRLGPAGAALAPVVDAGLNPALDAAIQPEVFLAVAEAQGYAPSKPLPGRAALTGSLRKLDDERVCVVTKKGGPCVLDFRNEAGTWKLVAFEGGEDMLRLPQPKL